MSIANSLPRGSILTMVALSKMGEAWGDVSIHLPYGFVRVLCRYETDRKNTWRVFLVCTIARVLFYEFPPYYYHALKDTVSRSLSLDCPFLTLPYALCVVQ